jgi:uncharacterized DUF497 family protein
VVKYGRFTWDEAKAEGNLRKHRMSFETATEALDDPLSVTIEDPDHSWSEPRYITVGATRMGEMLVVSHTNRMTSTRLISARPATKAEIRRYMHRDMNQIRDEESDELRPEYDFTNGVRGMFAPTGEVHAYRIDADLVEYFPTAQLLNDTLRELIAEGRIRRPEFPYGNETS